MVLLLTHRDLAELKRDRDVPVADISFAGGVMRYLGVLVKVGGISESALQPTPHDELAVIAASSVGRGPGATRS
jgi:hypothetical protein